MNNRFEKKFRLLSSKDFTLLKGRSSFFYSNSLLAFGAVGDDGLSRIGLSISKKFGNAVQRNRLKRQIREYFRTSDFKQLGVSVNFVPNLKKNKKQISTKAIQADLHSIFLDMQNNLKDKNEL